MSKKNNSARVVDRREDLIRQDSIWKNVASILGYDYKPTISYDSNDFSSLHLRNKISILILQNDDIVVVYFTGHVKRNLLNGMEVNPLPILLFDNDIMPNISVDEIDILLQQKCYKVKPRNIFIIADCCNNEAKRSIGSKGIGYISSANKPNIKQMFKQSSFQKFIICAADTGDVSYSDTDCSDGICGSWWSLEFQNQLYNLYYSTNLEKLLEKVKQNLLNDNRHGTQNPICQKSTLPAFYKFTISDELSAKDGQNYESVELTINGKTYREELNLQKRKFSLSLISTTREVKYALRVKSNLSENEYTSQRGRINVAEYENFQILIDLNNIQSSLVPQK